MTQQTENRAPIILVEAFITKGKGEVVSKPFRLYYHAKSDNGEYPRHGDIKLPEEFVLRLDDTVSSTGEASQTISNKSLSLVATHKNTFCDERLTGFRYKEGNDVFIVCRRHTGEDMPEISTLSAKNLF